MDYPGKKSLKLHAKFKGKMEIKIKVPLWTMADLSLAYTPGVAEVCKKIAANGALAKKYTIKNNTVAIITDGSAVLGLGNIGPLAALPVMEGKAILHKRFANIDAFPICLDTQDTEEIIRTVKNIAPVFAAIHLEDIAAPRCFEIERRLRAELDIPVLHDDQHCTAVVVLAGLINALKVSRLNKAQANVVINGAGGAGIAIGRLLLAYGFKNLVLLDSQGSIYRGRKGLSAEKLKLAKLTNRQKISGDLPACLKNADIFIGVSKGGLLKAEMVKQMNKNPVIFALSNPIPEIMPAEAKKAGARIIATGRGDFPNQINNVLVFPGLFRGALDNNVREITEAMLLKAANNLSALVKFPTVHKILPDLFDTSVAQAVAGAVKN
ncbi:MAG: NADP-dependent malic enzyme [Candidatus Doudnabacteria bacterium]|nr:NADP-dependent malic enzyme [Candidatus Doudnabacteria bacterium]